jgi:hypothetical protein
MRRRRVLALAGAGVTSALAGCGGNGSDGDTEAELGTTDATAGASPNSDEGSTTADTREGQTATPSDPAFTVTEVTGPETVPIGRPFSVRVTVRNDGAAGTFTGTVETDGEPAPATETLEADLGAGETATLDVEIDPPRSLEPITVTLASASASHEVSVGPQAPASGERVRLIENVEFTFDAVSYPNSLFYEAPGTLSRVDRVLTPPTDRRLVVVRATFENVGTAAVRVDGSLFGVAGGDLFAELPGGVAPSNAEFDAAALAPESELRIPSTETREAVLIGLVPVEPSDSSAVIYQQAPESDPAVRFELPTPETGPSEFTLEAVDAPDTAQEGQSYDITVTVSNEKAAGTFRGVFQYDDDGEWATLGTADEPLVRREFEAGETRQITVANSPGVTGTFTYRLAPLTDTEWTTNLE